MAFDIKPEAENGSDHSGELVYLVRVQSLPLYNVGDDKLYSKYMMLLYLHYL